MGWVRVCAVMLVRYGTIGWHFLLDWIWMVKAREGGRRRRRYGSSSASVVNPRNLHNPFFIFAWYEKGCAAECC